MPRLLINPGTPQQWEIDLKAGLNTIGRAPSCDVQIEHNSVSSAHCEVTVRGTSVLVQDLESTNGTFLNRQPVDRTPWLPGQRLQVGGVEMELVLDLEPPAIPPPRASPSAAPVTGNPSPPLAPPRAALRVAAQPSAAPALPPPPPVSVADEYAAETTGPAMCRYHPKSLARYLCTHCQLNFCELCITARPGGVRTGKFCRRCSYECVVLNVQLVREGADKENFFATIPGMFAYPLKGNGLVFLICGTIFLGLLDFLGAIQMPYLRFGFFLRLLYVAYTFAYVQRVIQTAAQGSDDPAGWPDVSDVWQDILVPCFQLAVLFLVCFGPALLLAIFLAGQAVFGQGTLAPEHLALVIGTGALGAIYYPMAFLAMAMFDSVAALNPLLVLPAICRVPLEYLSVLVLTAIIILAEVAQGYLLDWLGIPVLPTLVTGAVALYLLTVKGRMLGLMYFAKRDRLGWFHS